MTKIRKMATIEKRTTHIDKQTGEVLYDNIVQTDIGIIAAEPAYVKLYIDDLGGLHDLSNGQRSILLYISSYSGYDGYVSLPLGIKNKIAKQADCTVSAINTAIMKLCKVNLLRHDDVGLYELNPDYFARGKWREIRERRKEFYTKTTYRRDGTKEVETNVIETLPADVSPPL